MMRLGAMPLPPEPTIRAVRAGDEITVAVEGGFARRHAPSDGVLVMLPDRDLFLPAALLVEALRGLGQLPRSDAGP